jgi:glycosyltransferase involved in cell wall biosynthesis
MIRERPMRIVVNDYSGHPFQIELSRDLARRGHSVLHLYSADFQTPKGDLIRKPDDPEGFAIKGIALGEPFQKYDFVRRRGQEIRYAHLIVAEIQAFRPDIVIASNNPLDAQKRIEDFCLRARIPFVFWLQDIYSNAIKSILGAKIPVAGHLIGLYYEHLEKQMLRRASRVVAITNDFLPQLGAWGVAADKITVIENWAPKDKIMAGARDNAWRAEQGLGGSKLVLYTGTLGLKHNPDLILAAARTFAGAGQDVKIVVASEGPQIDYLRKTGLAEGLGDLILLPFQPFEKYADVLAAADVLIAMIEPDAAAYSVPSKILSYHCSGRAIVLSAAKGNLAAKIIAKTGSGIVAAPGDSAGFVAAIRTLLDDDARRLACGERARAYADETFDLVKIGGRFETLLADCLAAKAKA